MSFDNAYEEKVSIEEFNFQDSNSKINSPRSLEAIFRLGIDIKELYYIDFIQFKKENPDIFALPKEIQIFRWEHANNSTKKLIKDVKEEREKIIKNNETLEFSRLDPKLVTKGNFYFQKKFNNTNKLNISTSNNENRSRSVLPNKQFKIQKNNTNVNSSTVNEFYSNNSTNLLEEELKLLETAKAKYKIEAHYLIENEIKNQILRKEQEGLLLKEQMDDESNKREAIRNKKLNDLEQRKQELLKRKQEIEVELENEKDNINNENNNLNENNLNNLENNKEIIIDNCNNLENTNRLLNDKENNKYEQSDIIKNEDYFMMQNNNRNIQYNNYFKKPTDDENSNNFVFNYFKGVSKKEALEYIKQSIDQIDTEIVHINKEALSEKNRRNQFLIREAETKKKLIEFKIKCEKIFEDERQKGLERLRLLELKDKRRIEILEEKKIKKVQKNEEMKNSHRERFEKTQSHFEKKLKKNSELYFQKQMMSEEKRKKLEELRSIALKNKIILHSQKKENIRQIFEKKIQEEEMKFIEFKKKMEEIDYKKRIVDLKKDEEIKIKNNELKMKANKTFLNRSILDIEDDKKKDNVVSRINNFFMKTQKKKEEKEREQMFISENNLLKRNDFEKKIKRIETSKEIQRMIEREKLEETYRKLDEFKEQRMLIGEKKRILSIEIANHRKSTLEKFQDFMNKNKDVTPELILQLFPYDELLLDKIKMIEKNNKNSKIIFRSPSHVCTSSFNKIGEKTLNDFNKYRTNLSFRSSVNNDNFVSNLNNNINNISNSKIMNYTRGFSISGFSNLNLLNKSQVTNKVKLEPLNEKKSRKNSYEIKNKDQIISEEGKDNKNNKNESKEKIQENEINTKNNFNTTNNKNNFQRNNNCLVKNSHISIFDSNENLDNNKIKINFYKVNTQNKNFVTKNQSNNNFSISNSKMISSNSILKDIKEVNKSLKINNMPIISSNVKFDDDIMNNIPLNNKSNKNSEKHTKSKFLENKIENVKFKRQSEMQKILKEEKTKQEGREIIYNKINNDEEKKKIENKIAMRKEKSTEKIIKINEENEKKLKDFEAKLFKTKIKKSI